MLKNLDCVLSATLVASGLLATACNVTISETSISASDTDPTTSGTSPTTDTDTDTDTMGTSAGCPGTSAGCPGTSAGCSGSSAGCSGSSAGCAGTDGNTVEESCMSYCDALMQCLPADETGFETAEQCLDDCMINSDTVATDECDGASISINECVAGLDCAGVGDWWSSNGDPPPCSDETIDVNIQCDGPAKCLGYCVVATECLSEEAMIGSFSECLTSCEGDYELLSMSCQDAFSMVNSCVATLTCDESLEWWNGDVPPYPCSDETDVLANCE